MYIIDSEIAVQKKWVICLFMILLLFFDNGSTVCAKSKRLQKKSSVKYLKYIKKASERYRVRIAVIAGIIEVESNFVSTARNKFSTATGLMQITVDCARDLGLDVSKNRDDRLDPELNIMAGTKYFKQQLDLFGGNLDLSLSAYHAGPINTLMWSGIPPISVDYVNKVKKRIKYYETLFIKMKK